MANDTDTLSALRKAVENHRSSRATAEGQLKQLREQYSGELVKLQAAGVDDPAQLDAKIADCDVELATLSAQAQEYITQVGALC